MKSSPFAIIMEGCPVGTEFPTSARELLFWVFCLFGFSGQASCGFCAIARYRFGGRWRKMCRREMSACATVGQARKSGEMVDEKFRPQAKSPPLSRGGISPKGASSSSIFSHLSVAVTRCLSYTAERDKYLCFPWG